ncbi:hypothetical protein NARC_60115 [Candidatus Nitrosocosmicus arcticus]|uniref:Uncharacterized protein n=1 Tax=Candidatus Nitrosocosmicus arcticus TaxID=2035267 RepID=A0A557SVU7_9ARCH|nr:hypothetical protein NARC_60115 [Candidatus Nitrosocosmicus arcticus]
MKYFDYAVIKILLGIGTGMINIYWLDCTLMSASVYWFKIFSVFFLIHF